MNANFPTRFLKTSKIVATMAMGLLLMVLIGTTTINATTYQQVDLHPGAIIQLGDYKFAKLSNSGLYLALENVYLCPRGSYADVGSCQLCSDTLNHCVTCSTSTICQECDPGYELANGTCIIPNNITNCNTYSAPNVCSNCDAGYYLDSNTCSSCATALPGCSICSDSNNCTTCESGYNLEAGKCVPTGSVENCSAYSIPNECSTCTTGYYLDGNTCPACAGVLTSCLACTAANNCTSCAANTILQAGSCHACSDAVANCSTCDGTACTSCASGHYLDNGNCPTCSLALPGCTTCNDGNACAACAANYNLVAGECIPTGSVPNCSAYSSPDVCSTCATGYILDFNTNTCTMNCNPTGGNCTTCDSPDHCAPTGCNSGYFSDNGACSSCSSTIPGCTTCGSGTICTSCDTTAGYVLDGAVCRPIPLAPENLTIPATIYNAQTITVSWDSSINATGYILERSCNSSQWSEIYQGATPSASNNLTDCEGPVQYRVKAFNTVTTIASPYTTTTPQDYAACIALCDKCSNAITCTTCTTGYTVSGNSCIPTGNDPNCITYSAPNICSACNTGYSIWAGVCEEDYCSVATNIIGTMQAFTGEDCDTYPTPAATNHTTIGCLTDTRDGKAYEVRKFADGKCWMVDNLAYGGVVDACASRTDFEGSGSATPTDRFGAGTYGDCRNNPSAHAFGYLYNYQAAIQSASAHYLGSYQPTPPLAPVQPIQGICPAGWHLPLGDVDGEFTLLNLANNGEGTNRNNCTTSDCNFFRPGNGFKGAYAGWTNETGAQANQSFSASWWSSTPTRLNTGAFRLNVDASNLNLASTAYVRRNLGLSVRCVADCPSGYRLMNGKCELDCTNPTHVVGTMQTFTNTNCDTYPTPTATSYTTIGCLTDERDGKAYEVRKFADGKCWMADNLAYGGVVDACASRTDFEGSGSATPTDRFGAGTYGDCRRNPRSSYYGYLYNHQASVQYASAYSGSNYQPPEPTQGICPTGWHLPSGGSSGEFADLDRANGGTGTSRGRDRLEAAFQFFRPGNSFKVTEASWTLTNYNHETNIASGGPYYWSSAQTNNANASIFGINSDFFYPGTMNAAKQYGFSVRCVKDVCPTGTYFDGSSCVTCSTTMPGCTACSAFAACTTCGSGYELKNGNCNLDCTDPTNIMGTMQGFTATQCATYAKPTATNYSANYSTIGCLTDERDGKAYEVRKFADGKCWMADNLAYGGVVDACVNKTTYNGMGDLSGSAWGYGECRNSPSDPDNGYMYNYQATVQNPSAYAWADYQPPEPTHGICPTGWHVPSGSASGELVVLDQANGGTGIYRTNCDTASCRFFRPGHGFNTVYTPIAYYYGEEVGDGASAHWMSSTQHNSSHIYSIYANEFGLNPGLHTSAFKASGRSVRCVKNTVDCITNCASCATTNVCQDCLPGYYLNTGACTSCATVLPNCLTCDNTGTCSTCINGYFLENGICQPSPAAPATITTPGTIYNAQTITISWSSVADATGYVLERSCGSEVWSRVYAGTSTTTTSDLTYCDGPVQFRVKAYRTIITNASPYTSTPSLSYTACTTGCTRCTDAVTCVDDQIVVFTPNVNTVGVWWWYPDTSIDHLDFAAANGVTEIYYAINLKIATNRNAAAQFVALANSRGIDVYYLAGEVAWLDDYPSFTSVMDSYNLYQQQNPTTQFVGVHLDVEPGQHQDWSTDRTQILEKYVQFVIQSTTDYGALDFAIAYWFDDIINGEPVYQTVIRHATKVAVMSFRDTATAMYGTAQEEVTYAVSLNKPILLSGETYSLEGDYVSYYEETQEYMYQELNTLKGLAGDYSQLGIAIHQIETWKALAPN